MLYDPAVMTVFFAIFALFALIGTWGREGKAQVGVVLFACFVASNTLWWAFPIEWRPALYPILDVLFALTCAKAGKETHSRVPVALISLSVMAVAANTAFGISGAGSWGQIHAYEITLNIIFVAQCLVTGFWGLADVMGKLVDFHSGARVVRRHPEPFRDSAED